MHKQLSYFHREVRSRQISTLRNLLFCQFE